MLHGTQLYGRVDTAGSDFFVATEFFHLFFLPLVPRSAGFARKPKRADLLGSENRRVDAHALSVEINAAGIRTSRDDSPTQ